MWPKDAAMAQRATSEIITGGQCNIVQLCIRVAAVDCRCTARFVPNRRPYALLVVGNAADGELPKCQQLASHTAKHFYWYLLARMLLYFFTSKIKYGLNIFWLIQIQSLQKTIIIYFWGKVVNCACANPFQPKPIPNRMPQNKIFPSVSLPPIWRGTKWRGGGRFLHCPKSFIALTLPLNVFLPRINLGRN